MRADFGGGPEHIYNLIKDFPEEIKFFIAAPKDFPYWDKFSEIVSDNSMVEIPHRKFSLNSLIDLIKFTKQKNIDIIHSHGKGAGIYSRLLALFTHTKCVHTFHGFHIDNYNQFQKYIYILLEKILSIFTAKIISVSKSELQQLIENNIAKKNKFILIENGIQIPDKTINEKIVFNNKLNVITTTRFNYQKNTELLLPIITYLKEKKEVDNFHFFILGNGEEEKQFVSKIEELNLKEHFTLVGFTEEKEKYYLKSFCYISTSRWEGLSLAILEAMSYGIPVIATNVVGNRDIIIHNENGFLFSLDKPEDAGEYLINLKNNFNLWKNFSINSRKLIQEKFNINKMRDKTYNLYKQLSQRLTSMKKF